MLQKIQFVIKLTNSKCDKTQKFTKLNNSKFDKTQKILMWQTSETLDMI